jgi:ADP-ribose pyrophosphatase YjhB (NUDIX family)
MAFKRKEPRSTDRFNIVLIGIIFDPAQRKILIGRKNGDPELGPKFSWGFPGTELHYGDDIDKILKNKLKEKTGYDVKNLGAIFSKTYPENEKLVAIYFLCEAVSGKLHVGGFWEEMKWVSPAEIEKHFTTSFHPRLKEYLLNLK